MAFFQSNGPQGACFESPTEAGTLNNIHDTASKVLTWKNAPWDAFVPFNACDSSYCVESRPIRQRTDSSRISADAEQNQSYASEMYRIGICTYNIEKRLFIQTNLLSRSITYFKKVANIHFIQPTSISITAYVIALRSINLHENSKLAGTSLYYA